MHHYLEKECSWNLIDLQEIINMIFLVNGNFLELLKKKCYQIISIKLHEFYPSRSCKSEHFIVVSVTSLMDVWQY